MNKKQKMQLGLAGCFIVLLILWLFEPGWRVSKILGIIANALLLLSMLLSYRAEEKERIPVFIKLYGQNGYALLHVLAEYSSKYSQNFTTTPNHSSVYEQNRLGRWVKSFIKDASAPDFSIYEYLGKAPCDSASWLESM